MAAIYSQKIGRSEKSEIDSRTERFETLYLYLFKCGGQSIYGEDGQEAAQAEDVPILQGCA